MTTPDDSARFKIELRELYEAAGRPKRAVLILQASKQKPPVGLNDKTLSDWLLGNAVPKSSVGLRFLVSFLETKAVNGGGYDVRGADWWEKLRARAWEHTHAGRGGRRRKLTPRGPGAVTATALGRVISDLRERDALAMEVRRSIETEFEGLPPLPPYLPRAHDVRLRQELAEATQGTRVIVVKGQESTGKTRACWEAIRHVLPGWRVWHPLTPHRPEAVVEALTSGQVGPRTVIWLNEAQMYLAPTPIGAGVAAALQQLLHDIKLSPMVVLGSIDSTHWDILTNPETPEHAAARELLLCSRYFSVPDYFTKDELRELEDRIALDPRLRRAAARGDGRVIQCLVELPQVARGKASAMNEAESSASANGESRPGTDRPVLAVWRPPGLGEILIYDRESLLQLSEIPLRHDLGVREYND